MNNKHVDQLSQVSSLVDTDTLVTEESLSLRKVSVATLKTILRKSIILLDVPKSYSGYQTFDGSSVFSRRGVYFTVKSLLDSVAPNTELRLFILDSTLDTYREAVVSVDATEATFIYAETPAASETFEKEDWDAFDGIIISPWGTVPGTEGFADAASEESIANRRFVFSKIVDGPKSIVSGKFFIDKIEEGSPISLLSLYSDADNFILVLYENEKIYFRIIADSNILTIDFDCTLYEEHEFSISLNTATGESTAIFDGVTKILQSAEGDLYGYEEEGDIYLFGETSGDDILVYSSPAQILVENSTIYIGKDQNNRFFDNPIFDLTLTT